MHASQQLVLIHGLGKEIVSAAHDSVDAVVVTIQTGEQYDGNQAGFWFGLHRLTKLEAGWVGHHHIQQGEINRVTIHSSLGLLAVRCTEDLVTLCAQQSGEQVAVRFVVIGYEDDFVIASRSRHRASAAIISTSQEGLRASTFVDRSKRFYPVSGNEKLSHETYRQYPRLFLRLAMNL